MPILELRRITWCACLVIESNGKISSLLVNHFHNEISSNNINNIPICLGIICHEPLEFGICYTFLCNSCVQFPPNNTLGFHVLSLHVVDSNRHYFVIDMASHNRPTLNTFDMIKHHIGILQVALGCICLTTCTPHPSIPFNQHFEKIILLPTLLPRKKTILNVVIRTKGFECKDGSNRAHVLWA